MAKLALLILFIAFYKKHGLTLLLTLEIICLLLILLFLRSGIEVFYGMMLICVGACEGVIGLRALIAITRVKTNV